MTSFLETELAGRPLGLWLEASLYILGGFLAGLLVSRVSSGILKKLSAKTRNRLDDIILAVTEKPLVFVLVLVGLRLGLEHLALGAESAALVDKAYYILVAVAAGWVLGRIIDAITQEFLVPLVEKTEGDLDDQLLPIVRKIGKVVVWALAILVGLKNAGYDVGALIAGLGIGGVAVALAAKDTLANFFGSLAIFIDRPFKMGDRIKVNGVDGTVVDIGIRTSKLKTLDNRIVTMPNLSFSSSPIENVSSEPSTKIVEYLDLTYATGAAGVERALAILRALPTSIEGIEENVVCGLSAFAESSLRLTFVFFIKKGADYLGTIDAVNRAVLSSFGEAGIDFAFPTRVVVGQGAASAASR